MTVHVTTISYVIGKVSLIKRKQVMCSGVKCLWPSAYLHHHNIIYMPLSAPTKLVEIYTYPAISVWGVKESEGGGVFLASVPRSSAN